ncbi:hypothetical protein [Enterobacter sp. C4G1]|uniref:hypothetical protein n=1 Tax=Enterobacter sp. C4G1 TaxID=3458724 RepID=UPI004067EF3A
MKNFLIENASVIQLIFIIVFFLGFLLLLFVSYVFNKDAYKEIVILYEQKFGRLPLTASMAKHASLIATPSSYGAKIGFIMGSLIFPYNRVTNHDMSIEAYHFIRKLPSNLTLGFRIEAALWVVSTLAFIIALCLQNFL